LEPNAFDPQNQDYSYTRTIPTSLTLFIFGLLYQLVLSWDALRLKNTIQIIGLGLYNVGLMIYGAVQIQQIQTAVSNLGAPNTDVWDAIRPYLVTIPCVLAVTTLLLIGVAWKLYDEFGWTIYKHIGADLRMKRRYLTFQVGGIADRNHPLPRMLTCGFSPQIYIALLKFDFFFFLAFTVQFLVVVISVTDAEFGLTIAAIPITIATLILAGYWTRKENRWGMAFVIVRYNALYALDSGTDARFIQLFLFAGMAYFIFKLSRIYTGPKVDEYSPVGRPLTTFAVITLILITLTIGYAVACVRNFGQGLAQHITKRKVESDDEKRYNSELADLALGQPPARMTID
jgi:hypothetical protein